jgi:hypothetical protein
MSETGTDKGRMKGKEMEMKSWRRDRTIETGEIYLKF